MKRKGKRHLWRLLGGGSWERGCVCSQYPLVEAQCRDGPVCFFVCMRFNITIVLCFAPSLCPRNCRTERASATSSPSGLWARSRGRERLSPHPRRVTSSEMTPSHPSRLLTSKWGHTTTEARGPSARSPSCTRQRKVGYRLLSLAAESDA